MDLGNGFAMLNYSGITDGDESSLLLRVQQYPWGSGICNLTGLSLDAATPWHFSVLVRSGGSSMLTIMTIERNR
jgi:hypothetical protein